MVVHLLRRADLFDMAVIHQHHTVCHFQCFFLIVCHEDRGDVQFVVQLAQPATQFLAHLGIECAKRFIQQQHSRFNGQRARQCDTLTLATAKLGREAIGQPITILIPQERRDEEPAILQRIRSCERVEHYETIRQRKDGRLVEVSLTVSPIRDADGKVIAAS